MSTKLSDGWTKQKLEALVSIQKGRIVPLNGGRSAKPYIGISSFQGNFDAFTISNDGIECVSDDILMVWDGERSGLCTTGLTGVIGSTLARLRSSQEISHRYLFHRLTAAFDFIQSHRTGTGVPHVPKDLGSLLEVDYPVSLQEQHLIAAILDTVDDAIQQTDALIAKLRQMKAGLLHDLLTCGLDEHGELRDPVAHPEQFQESALGVIPVGWEVRTLGEVGDWLSGGTPSKSNPAYWDGSIPWVSPKDMKVFLLEDTEDHVSELGAREGSRIVPPETVLIVVRGMILAHTFPVAITMCEMSFNQDMKAIIVYENVSATYLAYWFVANSSAMLGLVTESTHGTKRFDLDDLLRYELQLPPSREQQTIVDVLATYDTRIEAERATREKLSLLKRGLMDDLLTGRVRVNELEEKA